MKNFTKMAIAFVIVVFAGTVHAEDSSENVLVNMFAWWNAAIKTENGFTEEGFAKYFTRDAAIVINGKESVRGTVAMVEHFRRIQANTESVEIVLPFEEGFESGNRIFTYHLIHARENGVDSTSHLMGYAVIEEGKIALVNFIAYDEEPSP
ncbi:MAG: hypothetical protein V3S12_03600 [Acidiferrobacterales bacterium]